MKKAGTSPDKWAAKHGIAAKIIAPKYDSVASSLVIAVGLTPPCPVWPRESGPGAEFGLRIEIDKENSRAANRAEY
jgi:hypothetical protein